MAVDDALAPHPAVNTAKADWRASLAGKHSRERGRRPALSCLGHGVT